MTKKVHDWSDKSNDHRLEKNLESHQSKPLSPQFLECDGFLKMTYPN
jgi:hypothetical protein